MALRLQSRLILWNLLLILVISFISAFFLTTSQLTFMIVTAVALMAILSYSTHVLILQPLREIVLVSKKLAAGNLGERLPITGDEEIAALGASLNTMAQALGARMQALSDGKQQLELILEAMGQGVMVLDRDGRITFTNTSLLKVLATGRELVGRTPLEVFRRPELETAVKSVLAGRVGRVGRGDRSSPWRVGPHDHHRGKSCARAKAHERSRKPRSGAVGGANSPGLRTGRHALADPGRVARAQTADGSSACSHCFAEAVRG